MDGVKTRTVTSSRLRPTLTPNYHQPALKWFDRHQRDLPWRQNRTPYRIWISEIMLQQTQVATVINYFNRFVKRFPDVRSLAAADESEVLKLWEGLGYYRRARQLHAAAKQIVEKYSGEFPQNFESVLNLPGIGRYTAGAILSIALNQRHPVLEGNTIRLFSRLMELRSDPRSTENQKKLWQFAESILPRRRAGDFNQAMMEIGNQLCTPKEPKCPDCPLIHLCPTFKKNLQEKIPVSGRKIKYESVDETVILVKRRNKWLIRLYSPGERWAGLWDFPRYRIGTPTETEDCPETKMLESRFLADSGLSVKLKKSDWKIKHAVTHYRITLHGFEAEKVTGQLSASEKRSTQSNSSVKTDYKWADLEELRNLPMSVTGRKIVKWIENAQKL